MKNPQYATICTHYSTKSYKLKKYNLLTQVYLIKTRRSRTTKL